MSEEAEQERPALTRSRLADAGLDLVAGGGLAALSMRGLADRLGVKAASLYWHVRDRGELVELLAEALLQRVPAPSVSGWRAIVLANAAALGRTLDSQPDAGRILLEVPGAVTRSDVYRRVAGALREAGLDEAEAGGVALMVVSYVAAGRPEPPERPLPSGTVASIAVDSGSRGVELRAGTDVESLIKVRRGAAAAAPTVVRGDTVKVRRLRGVGRAEIELDPGHPWRFQVHGATWNTVLDLQSLDVREIKIDSGAAKVEIFLPHPRGVVPIEVSGGVAGLKVHRPADVAVAAEVKSGAVRLRLGELSVNAVMTDFRWESDDGASHASDRYEVRIHGGAVQVELDTFPPASEEARPKPAPGAARPMVARSSALDVLLDGVETRLKTRP